MLRTNIGIWELGNTWPIQSILKASSTFLHKQLQYCGTRHIFPQQPVLSDLTQTNQIKPSLPILIVLPWKDCLPSYYTRGLVGYFGFSIAGYKMESLLCCYMWRRLECAAQMASSAVRILSKGANISTPPGSWNTCLPGMQPTPHTLFFSAKAH